ncbi:hypothetical protein JD844_002490 [Phrynosoma platyrhinos]|uniref:MOSC domain-containing protein n=1 Tax=Phrynosoma platyrhinos TaxID=52577 RepID=A0ABQ7TCB8_PHRPL|nr:hypothetical protein JD844_002490 [Phrynosoma platyrhinos]
MENIKQHTFALAHYTYSVLSTLRYVNGAPVVHIYSDTDFSSPDIQGPIINFNVLDENGEIIGYSQVDKLAGLYNIHMRTGCFCNTGACQQHLGISSDDIKKNLQAGHVCGDDIDVIDGRPTGSVRISFGYMSTFEDAQAFLKFIITTRLAGCRMVRVTSSRDIISEFVASPNENVHACDNRRTNKLPRERITGDSHLSANSASEIMPVSLQPAKGHAERDMPEVLGNSIEALPRPVIVTNIYLYPIKSCAAFEVTQWPVGNQGLLYDRNWMVANQNGVCITQKQEPRLCLVQPLINLEQNIMIIKAEGMDPISVSLEEKSGKLTEICQSKICSHRVQTYDCGRRVADWFSEFLGRQCHLIRQNTDFKRNANKKDEKGEASAVAASLSLVNEAQYLLINKTSVLTLRDHVSERLGESLVLQELIHRFRANIVISTNEPFEEDLWEEITIGSLNFKTNFGIYLMNHPAKQSSLPDTLSVGSQLLAVMKDSIISSASAKEQKSG